MEFKDQLAKLSSDQVPGHFKTTHKGVAGVGVPCRPITAIHVKISRHTSSDKVTVPASSVNWLEAVPGNIAKKFSDEVGIYKSALKTNIEHRELPKTPGSGWFFS